MKTNELIGAALDWAVAEAGGVPIYRSGMTMTRMDMDGQHYWQPSTDWAQGGPIIEREGMHIDCLRQANHYRTTVWEAWPYSTGTKHIQQAPTPLIAAMRCYVSSKLGDDVTLPPELEQIA